MNSQNQANGGTHPSAKQPASLGPKLHSRRISEVGLQVAGMAALLALLFLIACITNPRLIQDSYGLRTLGIEMSILAIFALGQGLIIIAGGIDLSVGSLMCFVGLNSILFLSPDEGIGWPMFVVIPMALAFSALMGAVHGALVCFARLQPFMVTLCSLLIFRSVARGLTDDVTIAYRERDLPAFHWLGNGEMLGIPVPVWILLFIGGALTFFMHFIVYGRYLYAIGYNLEAARFSGVRVHALRIFTFALGSFLAGVSGILEASNILSVAPSTSGMAYELRGITAAVLGGCALRGGQGSIIGILIGAAILKILQNMIIFIGLGTQWTDLVIGLVLLSAVIVDSLVKRRRGY